MSRQSLEEEIRKYIKLAEVGMEIYQSDKDPHYLNAAIYWSCEADKCRKILKECYENDQYPGYYYNE